MRIVSRDELIEILSKWQSGNLNENEVHDWAEQHYLSDNVDYSDWYAEESLTCEIMSHLDTLFMDLIIKEDIQYFLQLLRSNIQDTKKSIENIDIYLKTRDFSELRSKLKNSANYSCFVNRN